MVRIFVNGKQVTKEELSNYEIKNERVKRIIADILARRNAVHRKEMVSK